MIKKVENIDEYTNQISCLIDISSMDSCHPTGDNKKGTTKCTLQSEASMDDFNLMHSCTFRIIKSSIKVVFFSCLVVTVMQMHVFPGKVA